MSHISAFVKDHALQFYFLVKIAEVLCIHDLLATRAKCQPFILSVNEEPGFCHFVWTKSSFYFSSKPHIKFSRICYTLLQATHVNVKIHDLHLPPISLKIGNLQLPSRAP